MGPGEFDWLLQVILIDRWVCDLQNTRYSSRITWHTLKFSLKRTKTLNFTSSEVRTMFRQETDVKTDWLDHMSLTHSSKTSWVLITSGLFLCSVLAFTVCLLCRYEKAVNGFPHSWCSLLKADSTKNSRIYMFLCVIKLTRSVATCKETDKTWTRNKLAIEVTRFWNCRQQSKAHNRYINREVRMMLMATK